MSCQWCGKYGPTISHHHPISKKDGGKETVKICSDCHYKVHGRAIISLQHAKDQEDYDNLFNEKWYQVCAKEFPLLKPEEYPCLTFMILNPPWMVKI